LRVEESAERVFIQNSTVRYITPGGTEYIRQKLVLLEYLEKMDYFLRGSELLKSIAEL